MTDTKPETKTAPIAEPKPTTSLALVPTTTDELAKVAKIFSRSSLVPEFFKRSPNPEADLYFCISFGMDLGFSPVQSLRAVNVIQGKPGLTADAMAAKVLSSGLAKFFRPVKGGVTAESSTWETCRKGSRTTHRQTFTLAEAKVAGVVKAGGNWVKWPQRMMSARAKSFLARDIYPEVMFGIYSVEELADMGSDPAEEFTAIDVEPAPVLKVIDEVTNVTAEQIDAAVVADDPPADFDDPEKEEDIPEIVAPEPSLLDQLKGAKTEAAIREVAVQCADVEDATERQILTDAWPAELARVKELDGELDGAAK